MALSFRTHVILLIAGGFGALGTAYYLVALPEFREVTRAAEARRLTAIALGISSELDRELRSIAENLERLAASPDVRSMTKERLDLAMATSERSQLEIIDFAVLDLNGIIVARPNKPDRVGEDRSSNEYFKVARNTGKTWIESAGISTSGNLSISIATPIRDNNEATVGILRGSLGFGDRNSWVYRAVTEASRSQYVVAILVDDQGVLIANSEKPVTRSMGLEKILLPAEPPTEGDRTAGVNYHAMVFAGVDRIAVTAKVPGARWTVVIMMKADDVLRPVNRVTRDLARTAGALFLLFLSLFTILASRLSEPLTSLTNALKDYGAGGVARPVPERGIADVKSAIESFNAMLAERERIQTQLIGARDAAERANIAKSEFLGNISHELRTPLTAILGFNELLEQSTAVPAATQAYWQSNISKHGLALLAMVNELLDLTAMESGELTLTKNPCKISAVLSEAVLSLDVLAKEKAIGLSFNAGSGFPDLFVTDAGRVRQIIINVVGNAIKFTDRGQITATSRFYPCIGTVPAYFEVKVQDTGCGIAPEHQEQIFLEFVQIDSSSTRAHGGTGIGLALARRMARQLGGNIVLSSSTPGIGSEFRITFS